VDDFENAVAVARKYYPEPPRMPPPEEPLSAPEHTPPAQVPLKTVAAPFELRIEGARARWRPVWRIRAR
jgi:hypothetical protein